MKKVECPVCGLINLDRFVTYPHCAGCGALLPDAVAPRSGGIWRRSVAAPWWVGLLVLFCVVLGASVFNVASDSGRRENSPLLVYAQVPHSVFLNHDITTLFNIDTVDDPGPETFRDVRLRLSREVLGTFSVRSVSPQPVSVFNVSGARYFFFGQLERAVPIRVQLRALQVGEAHFNAQIYVRDYQPFDCRAFVEVAPPPAAPGVKSHVQH